MPLFVHISDLTWYLLHNLIISLQSAFVKYIPGSGGGGSKTTSFNLRLILWEAGVTVSNKVLECLVLRSVIIE